MKKLLVVLCGLLLWGCGFHLRGATDLPFRTIYIALPEVSELRATLSRNIRASSQTQVVNHPQEAEATLTVVSDVPAKRILSLNSSGRVREYELVRTFRFRLHDGNGNDFIPLTQIVVRRDITYSDDLVLSKETEEALLLRDMQTDLVQQLLRRLAAAKSTPTDAVE